LENKLIFKSCIIVITHRRSGTHLVIDSIRNNFHRYKNVEYINLDKLCSSNNLKTNFSDIKSKILSGPSILKTHQLPDLRLYTLDHEEIDFFKNVFKYSKIIYVERDGRDVMISLYHYCKNFDQKVKSQDFNHFLISNNSFDFQFHDLSRPAFWKFHVLAWEKKLYEQRYHKVFYEQIINNYEEFISNLSNFLDEKFYNIIDVRMEKKNTLEMLFYKLVKYLDLSNKSTSVGFRSGNVGDYLTYFSDMDIIFFENEITNIESDLYIEK
jgi:hypothetical protein